MKAYDYNIKLTPALAEEIIKAVKLGNHIETAAMVIGVSPVTLNEWLEKGSKLSGKEPYRSFALGVRNAWAESERELVGEIRKAGVDGGVNRFGEVEKDWRALAWLLERKDPKRWGLQIQVNVREELSQMLNKLEQSLTPTEYEKVLSIITEDKNPMGLPEHVEADANAVIAKAAEQTVEVPKRKKEPPPDVH